MVYNKKMKTIFFPVLLMMILDRAMSLSNARSLSQRKTYKSSTSDNKGWDPARKDLKICSVANGLDLTRLRSFMTRAMFRDAMEDVELMREYVTEAMYNDGLRGGLSTLKELAATCDWKERGLPPNSTTLDADIGWADDRVDRRLDRHVGIPDEPLVGTKQTDMAFLDTTSNIFPWLQDRRSKESTWLESHQNGRSEGFEKGLLPYDSLYVGVWSISVGNALTYYPSMNKVYGQPFSIGDAVGGQYKWNSAPVFPVGWPFKHTEPERIKDAIFVNPYADVAHPGVSMISAIAPVYYTGIWRGFEYKDTYIATVGADITLNAIAEVLSNFEDTLADGSFAMLVDSKSFDVIALSQTVVDKIYPRFTGNETERTVGEDRRNKPYLVSDTIWQSLVQGLESADWELLRQAVLATPRGERGYITLNVMETSKNKPTEYYAMFDRWDSVTDWTVLVLVPVHGVKNAMNPSVKDLEVKLEANEGDLVDVETTLFNNGTMDFTVMLSDKMPRWIDIKDSERFKNGIVVEANDRLDIRFQINTNEMRVGTTADILPFIIQDDGYPDCLYVGSATISLSIRVFPEPDLNQLGIVRIPGLVLCGIMACAAIAFIIWIVTYQKHRVVRSSQPFFLIMLCVGVLVMSSTTIPLSVDDGVCSNFAGCDKACMASPWLISIGFVTCFSALFSKLWRVNRIFHHQGFKRLVVTRKDALIPFAVLFTGNFACLLAWTLVDPLVWKRKKLGEYDSYGVCAPKNGDSAVIFVSIIAAINLTALLLACYEAYQARMISDEYSETSYIGMAVISMLQVSIIGVPVMFLVNENPAASFFVCCGLIFIIGMSVLLLIMVPKIFFVKNHKQRMVRKSVSQLHGVMASARVGMKSINSVDQSTELVHDNEEGELPVGVRIVRLDVNNRKSRHRSATENDQLSSSFLKENEILKSLLAKHGIDFAKELRSCSNDTADRVTPADKKDWATSENSDSPRNSEEEVNTETIGFVSHESCDQADKRKTLRKDQLRHVPFCGEDSRYSEEKAITPSIMPQVYHSSGFSRVKSEHDSLQEQLYKVWLRRPLDASAPNGT
jgi:hypothetical protein